jgi:hypothetical protein
MVLQQVIPMVLTVTSGDLTYADEQFIVYFIGIL